jgi:hypothetical protein
MIGGIHQPDCELSRDFRHEFVQIFAAETEYRHQPLHGPIRIHRIIIFVIGQEQDPVTISEIDPFARFV